MTSTYVQWGTQKVKLIWNGKTGPEGIVTSVHGFCFDRSQLLLMNLKKRGWDFPGGHVDEKGNHLKLV